MSFYSIPGVCVCPFIYTYVCGLVTLTDILECCSLKLSKRMISNSLDLGGCGKDVAYP